MDLDVRAARERIVRGHMEAENQLDFDAALASFTHPHYELIGLDVEFDGADAVREYFRLSRAPFPDQHNELIALHHADDAVVVELWLMGTHLGQYGDLAPTGRTFRVRIAAVFVFEGTDLVSERVYFNPDQIRAQLLA